MFVLPVAHLGTQAELGTGVKFTPPQSIHGAMGGGQPTSQLCYFHDVRTAILLFLTRLQSVIVLAARLELFFPDSGRSDFLLHRAVAK